jgi:hypothetical protein
LPLFSPFWGKKRSPGSRCAIYYSFVFFIYLSNFSDRNFVCSDFGCKVIVNENIKQYHKHGIFKYPRKNFFPFALENIFSIAN